MIPSSPPPVWKTLVPVVLTNRDNTEYKQYNYYNNFIVTHHIRQDLIDFLFHLSSFACHTHSLLLLFFNNGSQRTNTAQSCFTQKPLTNVSNGFIIIFSFTLNNRPFPISNSTFYWLSQKCLNNEKSNIFWCTA